MLAVSPIVVVIAVFFWNWDTDEMKDLWVTRERRSKRDSIGELMIPIRSTGDER